MNWEPTMNLRFVKRLDRNPPAGAQVVRTVRILQQQWTRYVDWLAEVQYEWRDVPEVDWETRSYNEDGEPNDLDGCWEDQQWTTKN
jgi:hypothetical protein